MWENHNTTVKIFPQRFSTFLSLSLSLSPGHRQKGRKVRKKTSIHPRPIETVDERDTHFVFVVYCPSHMSVNLTVVVSLVVAENSLFSPEGRCWPSPWPLKTPKCHSDRFHSVKKGTHGLDLSTVMKLKITDLITFEGWFFVSAFPTLVIKLSLRLSRCFHLPQPEIQPRVSIRALHKKKRFREHQLDGTGHLICIFRFRLKQQKLITMSSLTPSKHKLGERWVWRDYHERKINCRAALWRAALQ